jgi:hypothetical protein
MEKSTAQRLVRDTLKAPFDRKRYRDFINELCNGFDESKKQSMQVPDAFVPHAKSCQRLGTFTSPEGEKADVLVVQLTESYKLDRTRTALRDFVAHKLKRGEGDDNAYKEAGLVAFVAPDSQSWRFSFVRMEYSTKRDPKTGKIKPEERLTPARRFSYLVGVDEECHTAQSRFLTLLQNTADHPTLAQIEDAFSVEAVTKEFFREYARLFADVDAALVAVVKQDKAVRDDFQAKGVGTVEFAKKLLGQIVFLYFIQKKGWLGVAKGGKWGEGPRHFMRQLMERGLAAKQCLFDDVLEPLFYDTLATDRGPDAWCKTFQCRIPFLNGGLFEPIAGYEWKKTHIDLPNDLFTNTQRSKEGDVGTGILDVFDRYNFTVNEAEPLEKEVAIDPEMLGKVFENLIEENRRKGLGAYYTPREIVHYMCQESLINYLDTALNMTRESLGAEKAIQGNFFGQAAPAQKALKVTTRREIVPRADIEMFIHQGEQISHYEAVETKYRITMPKAIEKNYRLIDEKLADITICDPAVGSGAFPVGIMTEIVRARIALTPYFTDVAERTPYYFKRHAIQSSLYGADIDVGAVEIAKLRLWLSLVVDEEDVQQIKPLPNLDYKVVVGNSLMGVKKNLINIEQFKELEALKPKFFDESNRTKKAEYKRQIEELIHVLTNGREEFDFEIYFSEVFHAKGGFDVVIANPPYLNSRSMAKESPEMRKLIQAAYSMTKGSWDIYIAFFEKGFRLLNQTGVLTFITPDKWISKPFGDELRIQTNSKIFSILKAGRGVFESVNVDAIVSIYVNVAQPFLRILEVVGTDMRLKTTVQKSSLKSPFPYDSLFSNCGDFLAKIDRHPGRLSELGLCENSCATDDAYRLREFIEEESQTARQDLYLRMINTGTIGKYLSKWGQREMVYLGSRYSRPVVNKKRFLQAFPKSYGKKSVRKKIILKGLNLLDACLDADGCVIPGIPTLVIPCDDAETLKLLLAIVNCALAFFYIKEKYPSSSYNEGTTFTKDMLNELPLPKLEPSDKANLVELVDQILAAKESDAGADVSAFQRKLDKLVYDLYGLEPEEIKLVQGIPG